MNPKLHPTSSKCLQETKLYKCILRKTWNENEIELPSHMVPYPPWLELHCIVVKPHNMFIWEQATLC
jgi:hypothetical protein